MEQVTQAIPKQNWRKYSPTASFDPEEYERRKQAKFRDELRADTERKKMEQLNNALEKSGLVNMIRTKTFDSFIVKEPWQEHMKRICEEYAENPKGWLLVSGTSGCGKTHLCTAVVGKLTEKHIPVWYMLYREEIEKLKSNSWTDPEERERLARLYKNAGTLYIDDLFKGEPTRTDINVMFELIDYRYREQKRTIISTELSLKDLSDIDTAIAGRISEMSIKAMIKNDKSRNYRMRTRD